MRVREAMSSVVLSIGPDHTLRQAAKLMSERKVGSVVVLDPDSFGVGIMTERDLLESLAAGHDPDVERAADHLTRDLVFAGPDWTLEESAAAMVRGGFRHLIVMDGDDVVGMLSVRDIVRAWSQSRSDAAQLT